MSLSNPDPKDKNPRYNYSKINLLGTDFTGKFQLVKKEENSKKATIKMELFDFVD